MEVCNCSMFCCMLFYVHSSIAIILMGKRELVALLNFSSWCLVMVERLFLAVPGGCLQFMIVVFPDHTHLLFFILTFFLQATFSMYLIYTSNVWCHFVSNLQRYDTISAHVPKRVLQFALEKLQYTGIAFI